MKFKCGVIIFDDFRNELLLKENLYNIVGSDFYAIIFAGQNFLYKLSLEFLNSLGHKSQISYNKFRIDESLKDLPNFFPEFYGKNDSQRYEALRIKHFIENCDAFLLFGDDPKKGSMECNFYKKILKSGKPFNFIKNDNNKKWTSGSAA